MSTVQSKAKFNKGLATINMPSNLLTTLIENEPLTAASTNIQQQQSSDNLTNSWLNSSDLPHKSLPLISSTTKNTNKAQLARQVTNVIKRHSHQNITDKII